MNGSTIQRSLQSMARKAGRPGSEFVTLYGLECVLDRLGRTEYRDDFVVKGGMLLAAYRLRRPTRDIDMQAVDFTLDADHMLWVLSSVAAVDIDDGLALDLDSVTVAPIRDADDYTGLRVSVDAAVGTARFGIKLDVGTGDPILPAVVPVVLPRLLGGEVHVPGHPLETVVAEKALTIVQRGVTSTRWRDFVDLVGISRTTAFTARDLGAAFAAVADHRRLDLRAIGPLVVGYGDYDDGRGVSAQKKWAAWLSAQGTRSAPRHARNESVIAPPFRRIVARVKSRITS